MRLLLALFALAAVNAFAGPMDPPAAAAPANVPGVYKQFTPPPTRVPTPMAQQGISAAHYEVHKDTMSIELRGGAAVPLGDLSKNNTTGYSGGLALVYGASNLIDAAFEVTYASMPYKLTVSAQPQTSLGIGVKAILKALKDEKLSVNFDGGMGYYFENVAVDQATGQLDANNLPITQTAYKSAGGMGFTLGMEIKFQFTPNFAASAMADATQVSLAGGTSDTPLYLIPSLNLAYTF